MIGLAAGAVSASSSGGPRDACRRPTCGIRSSGRSARWPRTSARCGSTARGACRPRAGRSWPRGSRTARRRCSSAREGRGASCCLPPTSTAAGTTFRCTRRSCRSRSRPCATWPAARRSRARVHGRAACPQGAQPRPGVYRAQPTIERLRSTSIRARARSTRMTPRRVRRDGARSRVDGCRAACRAAQAQQTESRQSYWQYGLVLMIATLVAESFVGTRVTVPRHIDSARRLRSADRGVRRRWVRRSSCGDGRPRDRPRPPCRLLAGVGLAASLRRRRGRCPSCCWRGAGWRRGSRGGRRWQWLGRTAPRRSAGRALHRGARRARAPATAARRCAGECGRRGGQTERAARLSPLSSGSPCAGCARSIRRAS